MKAEIIYYEPVEITVGPVKLTVLRIARREEVEIGEEKDVSRLYDKLTRIVSEARKRGRNLIVEARVSSEGKEAVYAESTLEGAKTLIYYRPARLRAVTVVREGPGGSNLATRHQVTREMYVYEGKVEVKDPEGKVKFVIIETDDGKRLLRKGEFTVVAKR
ncbi:hypothetical protein Pyrfu_0390 [Pyrolobus fumarii 1A]|uniref:Uncharacterized protein n=1 Tax=Pyrolobus fumarii (strain DSM 11204 / 1A) TaxID=694429 RepID=G0EFU1_PYRF1|nr:hypothetical protein [Pyrolobus fumarii]AEM38262.1 hypothetical protein Pyrfu_0390 [Pyrolobus fumarii 1A]